MSSSPKISFFSIRTPAILSSASRLVVREVVRDDVCLADDLRAARRFDGSDNAAEMGSGISARLRPCGS